MTFEAFLHSLSAATPPEHFSEVLQVLWYDGKNDWEAAHQIAQDIHTPDGSLLHAYIHRKEGDRFNAGYWYRQANRPMPQMTLEEEWQALFRYFIKAQT